MDPLAYLQAHAPRCTHAFATSIANLPDVPWDGHGEELNTIFALTCRCGNSKHTVYGYKWHNPDYGDMEVLLSPIELRCTFCESNTMVLDTDLHGYNAELGHGSSTVRAQGEPAQYQCERCKGTEFEPFLRFEYTGDLFDGDFDDFPGKKEDLFTWVTLVGRCSGCNDLVIPTEFECA